MSEYIMQVEVGNSPITVQKLVRCKDCKHFMPLTGYSLCVAHGSDAVDADDFCSWAERKETEDE